MASGSTQFYSIPYMCAGDYLTEVDERRKATIIDNLLYVATYGATKAVVEDCLYTLSGTTSDPCVLKLSDNGSGFVFLCIVGYRLAYRKESISFSLAKGRKYYIVVRSTSGMDVEPELCAVESLDEAPQDSIDTLLLATVDYTGEQATLDTDSGKRYMSNLAAHTMDCSDPHGTDLNQTRMTLHGHEAFPCFVSSIETGGLAGVSVPVPSGMTAVFATAVAEDLSAGNLACSISEDGTSVTVVNSGEAGVKARVRIDGRYGA